MSRIALDWDGTVTADRPLWFAFVALAKANGHEVSIVTCRTHESAQEVRREVAPLGIEVIATDGQPKWDAAYKPGAGFDIWIDDMPHMIFKSVEY